MMPGPVSRRVIVDRLEWATGMVAEIQKLPLHDRDKFLADNRNAFTAESCLRRALEALLDCGRHILARGFAVGATEYKEVAARLGKVGVLSKEDAARLRILAGYRNRLVHFYHEVSHEELFEICSTQLGDVTAVADGFRRWIKAHEETMDDSMEI
jgi:uncharacterized protein YutE (UPF0331/DUF86 family)